MKPLNIKEELILDKAEFSFVEKLERTRPLMAGYLYATLAIVFTNFNVIVLKMLYEDSIHPATLILPRALIQMLLALALKSRFEFDPMILFAPYQFLLAFCTMLQTSFWVLTLNYLLPSDASVLMMSSPLFAVLFSIVLQTEKADFIEIATIVGAIIGIVLIVQPNFLFAKSESLHVLGAVFAILVAVCQTIVTFLIRYRLSFLSQIDRVWLSGCGIFGSGFLLFFTVSVEAEGSLYTMKNLILFFFFTGLAILYQFFNLRVTQFLKVSIYLTISYNGLLIVIVYDILTGKFTYDWIKILGMAVLIGSCLLLIRLSFK